jgi:ADP-ribosylglycohydrolase
LIGQCLGDALGFGVEGCEPAVCQEYVSDILRTGRAAEQGNGWAYVSQYTDDSQLARELLQSFAACTRFDPQDYAGRIAAIFTEGRIVGRGTATTRAALRLAQGVPWQVAGTPPPVAGNGSAMRAAPIGLLFFDHPPRMIQAGHDQGRITHQDPCCSAGAVAIAGAVALVLRGEPIQRDAFLSQLSEWSGALDASVAAGLRHLAEWSAWPPDQAAKEISTFGRDQALADGWEGISPFVTGSVLWSLYSFLRTPEDYWETVCTAIAVGGDVDTTAAMAGAISGAYLGLHAIPKELALRLTDRHTWGFAELVALAEQCYACKMQQIRSGTAIASEP